MELEKKLFEDLIMDNELMDVSINLLEVLKYLLFHYRECSPDNLMVILVILNHFGANANVNQAFRDTDDDLMELLQDYFFNFEGGETIDNSHFWVLTSECQKLFLTCFEWMSKWNVSILNSIESCCLSSRLEHLDLITALQDAYLDDCIVISDEFILNLVSGL